MEEGRGREQKNEAGGGEVDGPGGRGRSRKLEMKNGRRGKKGGKRGGEYSVALQRRVRQHTPREKTRCPGLA